MNLAWAAADLAVIRAGAGSIAELLEFQVPAVLIPYIYAADNHQEVNADYIAKFGLASKVREEGLTPQQLSEKLQGLYENFENIQISFRKYKNEHLGIPLSQQILDWAERQGKGIC